MNSLLGEVKKRLVGLQLEQDAQWRIERDLVRTYISSQPFANEYFTEQYDVAIYESYFAQYQSSKTVRDTFHLTFASISLFELPAILQLQCSVKYADELVEKYAPLVDQGMRSTGLSKDRIPPRGLVNIILDGTLPPSIVLDAIDHAYAHAKPSYFDSSTFSQEQLTPVTIKQVKQIIQNRGMENLSQEITELLLPSYSISTRQVSRHNLARRYGIFGRSKFGGYPDLPEEIDWHDIQLPFLGQINLADLPALDGEFPLPPKGMLYFFFDHECQGRVIFYNDNMDRIKPKKSLYRLPVRYDQVYPLTALEFLPQWDLPYSSGQEYLRGYIDPVIRHADWLLDYESDEWSDGFGDMESIQDDLRTANLKYFMKGGAHQLLGYANPIQHAVTKAGERILIEFGSDDELGWMWGDGGRIYFVISEEDLAALNFDNVHIEFQCN